MEIHLDKAREIFNKINELRMYPKKMANKIAFMMSYINKRDNIIREPNRNSYKLIEGIKAFEEAITFLKNLEPVEELVWEEFISKLCSEQSGEVSKRGLNMYELSETKAKYEDKMKKFATFSSLQDIYLFTDADPHRIVIDLVICDGDNTRTNRNYILSSNFRQIGVGIEPHSRLGNVCVVYLARNWKLRHEAPSLKSSVEAKEENNSLLVVNLPLNSKYQNAKEKLNKSSVKNEIEIKNEYDDLVKKYEKELDQEIEFDDYIDKLEEKQIIREGNKLKIIKKFIFNFADGNARTVILSRTINLNKSNLKINEYNSNF